MSEETSGTVTGGEGSMASSRVPSLSHGTTTPSHALVVERLSKRFGGAQALDNVSLDIRPGEIHGLLGENGSGKSTLIKILAGYHAPDAGASLRVGDTTLSNSSDQHELRQLGVSFVHQDLGLIPSLSVTDNFLLLRQDELARHRISWRDERRRVTKALQGYGVDVRPTALVEDLSPLQRALVAVVRAVEGRTAENPLRLLVLDEPTVFLPAREVGMLFSLMRRVAAEGAGVLFVTHDMGEVLEITDRVTVLRDGRLQGTLETNQTSEQKLVELILGRTWAQAHARQDRLDRRDQPCLTEVIGLCGAGLSDVSLKVHAGEVLGVTGLVGSGFEQLPYMLVGGTKATAGQLQIGDWHTDLSHLHPAAAVNGGIALVPGDRLSDGVVPDFSVAENITLPVLMSFFSGLRLRRRNMTKHALELMKRVDVRPLWPSASISALSGGNQQKAVIAKWLQVQPRLLILHEPTQGVDVGARAQIVHEVRTAAANGTAVIVATSDYEHLEDVADRVLVLADGVLREELTGAKVTKRDISEVCLMSTSGGNYKVSTLEVERMSGPGVPGALGAG